MTVEGDLSPDLMEAVQALEKLDDGGLWRLAREAMSLTASQELEALHNKQRDGGLSPEKDATHARLIHEYERVMLLRAQVAKLLGPQLREDASIVDFIAAPGERLDVGAGCQSVVHCWKYTSGGSGRRLPHRRRGTSPAAPVVLGFFGGANRRTTA